MENNDPVQNNEFYAILDYNFHNQLAMHMMLGGNNVLPTLIVHNVKHFPVIDDNNNIWQFYNYNINNNQFIF